MGGREKIANLPARVYFIPVPRIYFHFFFTFSFSFVIMEIRFEDPEGAKVSFPIQSRRQRMSNLPGKYAKQPRLLREPRKSLMKIQTCNCWPRCLFAVYHDVSLFRQGNSNN